MPVVNKTISSASPTMSNQFGSFAAALAPSRLWSDRVDGDDRAEQEAPPLTPPLSLSHSTRVILSFAQEGRTPLAGPNLHGPGPMCQVEVVPRQEASPRTFTIIPPLIPLKEATRLP